MLTKEKKKELIARLGPETPSVIIGQNGISDSILEEIRTQLKKKKAIKISLPNGVEDKKEYVSTLCRTINAEVVDLRGRKLIIHKD